jgi:crystallin, alpha B
MSRYFAPSLMDQNFGLCIGPEDLIVPHYSNNYSSNYYRPWKWGSQNSTKDLGSTIQDEKDKFQISLDVQQFKPNDINVRVVNDDVVIEGTHEEREDDHGFISRHFKRRYVLPKDCKADSVVSSLSSDGILIITAEKRKDPARKEITVPIKLCKTNLEINKLKGNFENKVNLENEARKHNEIMKKQCTALMVKEDHCRLLRPELLGKETVSVIKNISLHDDREKDNIFEASTTIDQDIKTKTAEKIEETMQRSSATMQEITKVQNMQSEMLQMQQHTSSSYTSSSIKETNEKISELVSDISAQLKEAAENI